MTEDDRNVIELCAFIGNLTGIKKDPAWQVHGFRWAGQISDKVIELEERWISVDTRLPKQHCGYFLITNNLNARDAFGHMSHVWLTSMLHEQDEGGYSAFNGDPFGNVVHNVTHWQPIVPPKDTQVSDKEKP